MFTGFKDNNKILTEAQKIWLIFQRVQIPSLPQFNNTFQVSYYLDQYKAVVLDLIATSMEDESAHLPEHLSNHQASGVDT